MENNLETNSNKESSKHSVVILLIVMIAVFVVGFFFITDRGDIDVDSLLVVGDNDISPDVMSEDISDEEREEIIQAIVENDSIMRSGDVAEIKSRLSDVYPELAVQFSDQDIESISQFYSENIPEVTAQDLRSDDVTWVIEENRVSASLIIDGREGVFEAVKIDGVWY